MSLPRNTLTCNHFLRESNRTTKTGTTVGLSGKANSFRGHIIGRALLDHIFDGTSRMGIHLFARCTERNRSQDEKTCICRSMFAGCHRYDDRLQGSRFFRIN